MEKLQIGGTVMKFAVIGGDMRQAKLAELLLADGHDVSVFAIDKFRLEDGVNHTDSAATAVRDAACVVLPLPVVAKERILNTPLSSGLHTTQNTFAELRPDQVICAGKVDTATAEQAASLGLELIDYLAREEFAIQGALATAEGAIGIIMKETAVTLCHLNCLVIGFGRIGKILCHRLRGMGAHVTASARKCADIAWVKSYGYDALETSRLDGELSKFDIIVNTVPARVLGKHRLQELKPGCFLLDLSSKPGGLDFSAASNLGVKALWALGLPGEVAPVSAGAAVRDTIYNILREKGVLQ